MLAFWKNIVEADYPNSNQENTPYDSVYIEINNGKCEQRSKETYFSLIKLRL